MKVIVLTDFFELILEITLFLSWTFFRESHNLYPTYGRGSLTAAQDIGCSSFSPSEKSDQFTTSLAWLRFAAWVN